MSNACPNKIVYIDATKFGSLKDKELFSVLDDDKFGAKSEKEIKEIMKERLAEADECKE